jgi:hypothetical protein
MLTGATSSACPGGRAAAIVAVCHGCLSGRIGLAVRVLWESKLLASVGGS